MAEAMRIIDNKRVLITDDEFKMFQKICRSYDSEYRKGEDLFSDHFETNGEGIIVFVKPSHNKYSSLEIYCFLTSIMVNQHLRIGQDQINKLVEEARTKITELVESAKKD